MLILKAELRASVFLALEEQDSIQVCKTLFSSFLSSGTLTSFANNLPENM